MLARALRWMLRPFLRLLNSLRNSVCFRFAVSCENLTAHLCSPDEIALCAVEFAGVPPRNGIRTIETRRRRPGESEFRVLNVSGYRGLEPQ